MTPSEYIIACIVQSRYIDPCLLQRLTGLDRAGVDRLIAQTLVDYCLSPGHRPSGSFTQIKARPLHGGQVYLRTHCPNGHEYNEENTCVYQRRNGTAGRYCKLCRREKMQKHGKELA